MSDEYCIKMVREMQEEHKEFETLLMILKRTTVLRMTSYWACKLNNLKRAM